jgi:TIM-barrel protein
MLGGVALDGKARRAARRSVENRNRNELLPSDPLEFIGRQLAQFTDTPIRPGVNVRSTTVGPVQSVAEICENHDVITELNAHCRQKEPRTAGCGEGLLADTERLMTFVEAASVTDAPASVKVRAEISDVHLVNTTKRIETAGGEIIHTLFCRRLLIQLRISGSSY